MIVFARHVAASSIGEQTVEDGVAAIARKLD